MRRFNNKIMICFILLNNILLFGQLKADLNDGNLTTIKVCALNDSTEVSKTDSISSFLMGITEAEQTHSSNKWFYSGLGAGIFFQLHGTAVTTIIAYYDKDYPEVIPIQCNKYGYIDGFVQKSRESNRNAAFKGGLVGTGVTVAAVLAVYAIMWAGDGP